MREELSRVHLQRRHEVEYNREAGNLDQDHGNVRHRVGDAKRRGPVERKGLMPRQDRPAREGPGGLGHGLEEVVEEGEEEDARPREDGFTGPREVVEEAAADEGLDDCRGHLDQEGQLVAHHDMELAAPKNVRRNVEWGDARGLTGLCNCRFALRGRR